MRKILILFLLSILFFMLDNVLVPFLAIKTIYPSLLLVFIICYSIVNGKWEGLWLGVFCGLLQDIYFANVFGLNALINMIICITAGLIGDNIFKEKILIPVVACFSLSFLKGALLLTVLYFLKTNINFKDIFFIALYDTVISVIVYKKVYRLCQKEYMQKKWKF